MVEPCSDQSCVELFVYIFIFIPEAHGHVDSADCPVWENGQLNTSIANSYLSSLRDLLLQDEVIVQCSEEGRKIMEGL